MLLKRVTLACNKCSLSIDTCVLMNEKIAHKAKNFSEGDFDLWQEVLTAGFVTTTSRSVFCPIFIFHEIKCHLIKNYFHL